MIVDTSALMAIVKMEPEAPAFATAMENAQTIYISAGTLLEVFIVSDSFGSPKASARLEEMLAVAKVVIEPMTVTQAHLARQAYRDYGKGSGHRAALNFGDCFSYALAREKREPLLFKGDDFGHTDLRSALSS